MVFAIVILIVVGVIAFFHYTQGLWSATLSAFCAVIAALVAVSVHEQLTSYVIAAKMINQAQAVTLTVSFSLVYVILRTLFDKLVPGNLRLPPTLDKVGGALMGIIAGVFATGIFVLAAQSLPFGPSVAGYSRYELEGSRDVQVSGGAGRQQIDTAIDDELNGNELDAAKSAGLPILPVDNLVQSFVAKQSEVGAMSGSVAMSAIHPNLANEFFGARLGVEPGAMHVAVNGNGKEEMKVEGVFRLAAIPKQIDAEVSQTRGSPVQWPTDTTGTDKTFLIVRATFDDDASDDKDKFLRFSPGGVRLVAKSGDGDAWANYTPIGTLEGGVLYANKADDFLFLDFSKGNAIDFVFLLPSSAVFDNPKAELPKVLPGVFVEVKRLARDDLSGKIASTTIPPAKIGVLRKPTVAEAALKAGAITPPAAKPGAPADNPTPEAAAETPEPAAASVPLSIKTVSLSALLFSSINTGTAEKNANGLQVPSGTLSLKEAKFSKLAITPTQTLTLMKQGSYTVSELYAPAGQKVVQVQAEPPAGGADAWGWADVVTEFSLKDSTGKVYKPNGAFAKVRTGREDRMVAAYDASAPISGVSRDESRPTEVYIAFVVPSGTTITSVDFKSTPMQTLQIAVQ